ncbi:hypothetical protein H9P43_008875 [Blastocladiella emersonii ATCC 22665]|nr:hypothetical protein H9P43_008875 [Blastocladiella emersonii ATCC 22665]
MVLWSPHLLRGLTSLVDPYRHLIRDYIYARPWLLALFRVYKYVVGLVTNTSELFRVCAREVARGTAERKRRDAVEEDEVTLHDEEDEEEAVVTSECIAEIDQSILFSNQLAIERRSLESKECGLEEVTQMIMLKKRFPGNANLETASLLHPDLSPEARVLYAAVSVIHESHRVIAEINARVATKYDATNKAHERKLLELWSLLMPGIALESRLTSQWGDIGFQGRDPATDFRGMGMQALDDLVYFAKTHPLAAAHILASSRHPVSWYSFAIVGINITAYVVQLLRTRQLQHYLYRHHPSRAAVHEFYCYVFFAFNKHWTEYTGHPPLTIMDFEREFAVVKTKIEQDLLLRTKPMVVPAPAPPAAE